MSIPTPKEVIDKAVAQICELGCQRVFDTIEQLEENTPISLLQHLTLTERKMVLTELNLIMDVYRKKKAMNTPY